MFFSTYYEPSGITIHITTNVSSDKFGNVGYYAICTTYPNYKQLFRWGKIKDLSTLDENDKLTYATTPDRADAIAFLIAFSSIHHSHKNIIAVTNSKAITAIISATFKDTIRDIADRIRDLEVRKNTISKLRSVEPRDEELIEYLKQKLTEYITNDIRKTKARYAI